MIMHWSICNLNVPLGKPPGIFGRQIPVPQFQKSVQMPHM